MLRPLFLVCPCERCARVSLSRRWTSAYVGLAGVTEVNRTCMLRRTHGFHGRAVAADSALLDSGLLRQLDHPHGITLAQDRLSEAVERRPGDGCAAAARDEPGRLHGAASDEYGGHEVRGVPGEGGARSARSHDRDAARDDVDDARARHVVRLPDRRWNLHGVSDVARADACVTISRGRPLRVDHLLPRVCGGTLAAVDLVPEVLGDHDQGDGGLAGLCGAHGSDVRVLLAALTGLALRFE